MGATAVYPRHARRRPGARPVLIALTVSIAVHITMGAAVSMPHTGRLIPSPISSLAVTLDMGRPAREAEVNVERAAAPFIAALPPLAPRAESKRAVRRPSRTPTAGIGSAAGENAESNPPLASAEPDERYYVVHELDVYPRLRAPLASSTMPGASFVRLRAAVALNQAGEVEEVSLLGGGMDRASEEGMAHALRRAGFHPARKDGRPVKSRIIIEVEEFAYSAAGER